MLLDAKKLQLLGAFVPQTLYRALSLNPNGGLLSSRSPHFTPPQLEILNTPL